MSIARDYFLPNNAFRCEYNDNQPFTHNATQKLIYQRKQMEIQLYTSKIIEKGIENRDQQSFLIKNKVFWVKQRYQKVTKQLRQIQTYEDIKNTKLNQIYKTAEVNEIYKEGNKCIKTNKSTLQYVQIKIYVTKQMPTLAQIIRKNADYLKQVDPSQKHIYISNIKFLITKTVEQLQILHQDCKIIHSQIDCEKNIWIDINETQPFTGLQSINIYLLKFKFAHKIGSDHYAAEICNKKSRFPTISRNTHFGDKTYKQTPVDDIISLLLSVAKNIDLECYEKGIEYMRQKKILTKDDGAFDFVCQLYQHNWNNLQQKAIFYLIEKYLDKFICAEAYNQRMNGSDLVFCANSFKYDVLLQFVYSIFDITDQSGLDLFKNKIDKKTQKEPKIVEKPDVIQSISIQEKLMTNRQKNMLLNEQIILQPTNYIPKKNKFERQNSYDDNLYSNRCCCSIF